MRIEMWQSRKVCINGIAFELPNNDVERLKN